MEKELISIFKPVFDGDPLLGQLLTNSENTVEFDELCAEGYFLEELTKQCAESVGPEKPCVVFVSKEAGMFGGDYISVDIICLYKYIFSGDRKLRPFEIVTQMNQVINHKIKLGDGTLEMEMFWAQPLNDEVGIYTLVYNSNIYLSDQDSTIDVIEYYKNHLFDTLTAVFDTDDVKKKLLMNGISAEGFPFEELIENEYIRLAPKFACENGGDSVYAVIQLEERAGLSLSIDIIGASGKNDTEIPKIRAKAKELSDIIDHKMLSMPGIQQSSYNENELNDSSVLISRAYSLPKTEEEIQKAESKKRIRVGFFADLDVLQKLPEAELLIGNTETGFSLDLIQAPVHLTFANKEFLEYGFYMRSDLGVYDEPDCSVKMYEDGGQPDIELNSNFAEESKEFLMQCLNYMTRLAKYVHEKGIIQQFSTMDMTKEGVLLYLDKNEIKYKLLHGKQRPDLMCTSLFNGTGMMRPYLDEVTSSLGDELMPFEDKLEAAENGDTDMMLTVANAYFNGEDGLLKIDTDPEKSAYWMEKAAVGGNATAKFNIGLFYAMGHGVKQSLEKAAEWMDKAAEAGNTDAEVLAEQYHSAAEAEKKAEVGDPQGQAEYAKALMNVAESLGQLGGK